MKSNQQCFIVHESSISFDKGYVTTKTKKEKEEFSSKILDEIFKIKEKNKDIKINDILFYYENMKMDLVAIAVKLKDVNLLEIANSFRYNFGEKSMYSPTLGKHTTPLQFMLKEETEDSILEDNPNFIKMLISFSPYHVCNSVCDKTKYFYVRKYTKRRL